MATAATPKKATEPRVDANASTAKDTSAKDTAAKDTAAVKAKNAAAADAARDTGPTDGTTEADNVAASAKTTGDHTTTTSVDGSVTTVDGHTVSDVTPLPEDEPDKRTSRKAKIERGECVVDDGTPHTGRAVNGLICSAHTMRYHSDGTLRGAA